MQCTGICVLGGFCDEPDKYTFDDVMKAGFLTLDTLLLDEETQVHGVVLLADFSEFGAHNVLYWGRQNIQNSSSCWLVCSYDDNKNIHN